MARTIKLTFTTDMDEVFSINIPRAKYGLASDVGAVKTAMDNIIATQAISTTAGIPKFRKGASIVETRTEEFGIDL